MENITERDLKPKGPLERKESDLSCVSFHLFITWSTPLINISVQSVSIHYSCLWLKATRGNSLAIQEKGAITLYYFPNVFMLTQSSLQVLAFISHLASDRTTLNKKCVDTRIG